MKMNFRLKIGLAILVIFTMGSFLLPLFNDVDPSQQGTYFKNLPISSDHLLGTNTQGQDIFWYLVYSVRNSLILGVGVSIFTTLISAFLGLSAGYIGGWYDRFVMVLTDSVISIPSFPILIVLGTLVRGNTNFFILGLMKRT